MFWMGTAVVLAVVLGGARLYDRKRKNHMASRTGGTQSGGLDGYAFTAQSQQRSSDGGVGGAGGGF